MATLRPGNSGRGYYVNRVEDLDGLEESAVDSDEEDVSSVNTEVIKKNCCYVCAQSYTVQQRTVLIIFSFIFHTILCSSYMSSVGKRGLL